MGKYDGVLVRLGLSKPPPSRLESDDWDPFAGQDSSFNISKPVEAIYLVLGEKPYDRKLRMLRQLSLTCSACTMCELGHSFVSKPGDPLERDPHVFSSMNPVRIMVVGQNPGWNELAAGTPFVGDAGANFDAELSRHGVSRDEFYICNANRCYSAGNAKPTDKQRRRCEPFLAMEIGIIKPKLIATLGAAAFESLCPGVKYVDGLGVITRSDRYDVPVFGVYHPSPRNLDEGGRRGHFQRQMGLLCGLVKALRGTNQS